MLTAIRATYRQGQLIWHETPPADVDAEVVVTLLEKKTTPTCKPQKAGSLAGQGSLPDEFDEALDKTVRQGGSMAGEVWMANDCNAPLDDLSDYM